MRFRLLTLGAMLAAIAASGLGAYGCGDESDAGDGTGTPTSSTESVGGAESAESLEDVLTGLEEAVGADETYNALDEASGLGEAEQATISSFCTILLGLKGTERRLGEEEFFLQVRSGAESATGEIGSASIAAAAAELRDAYALASIHGEVVTAYAEGCFGGPPPGQIG